MLSYCLEYRKNTESKIPRVPKTKHGMLLSNRGVRSSKKLRYIKEQETSGLLSSLIIKRPLGEIFLVSPILFQGY